MKEYRLPKEFAEKWLKALRSGKYLQTEDILCDGYGYCCLGVAAHIGGASNELISCYTVIKGDLCQYTPKELHGRSKYENLVEKLTDMNDNGKSFTRIADWIEQNVEFY